jgi:hypothetical protein
MRQALIALLIIAAPAAANSYGFGARYGARYGAGNRHVIRVGSQYLGRGLSRYHQNRRNGYSGRDQSWRIDRRRRNAATHDPYSYGRCYWRGYYRPRLYCRKYTPRYGAYQSVTRGSFQGASQVGRRYPYPRGLRGQSYPQAYARPALGAGFVGGGFVGGQGAAAIGFGAYGAAGGYGGAFAYGGVSQSRYGYRHPHAYHYGGSGPYGFNDPWGYRLLPAFDFAPILTRLTTVFTIDDPAFDGDEEEAPADGLPQPRTKPVGGRFLTPVD